MGFDLHYLFKEGNIVEHGEEAEEAEQDAS